MKNNVAQYVVLEVMPFLVVFRFAGSLVGRLTGRQEGRKAGKRQADIHLDRLLQ
jgi:hypothetical protein